jgi:hypothetical protein
MMDLNNIDFSKFEDEESHKKRKNYLKEMMKNCKHDYAEYNKSTKSFICPFCLKIFRFDLIELN